MTPLGAATLTNWHDGAGIVCETSYVSPSARWRFEPPAVSGDDYFERVLGCILMWEFLPPQYVHDAFTAVCKIYQFALEDEEFTPLHEAQSLSRGAGIGVSDDYW